MNTPGVCLNAPIGVFDSGIGGLSILSALRAELPGEPFVYFADSAHAPYGERHDSFIATRSLAIANELRERHGIRALVVACNTATAVAISAIRARYPDLPVVGVEPAIKPAVTQTRTGRIGVLATRGTVNSLKFKNLLAGLSNQATFTVTACDGLARAIETQNESAVKTLIHGYIRSTGTFGPQGDAIDTLVLGCTHYPLERAAFQEAVGAEVMLVEPGKAVAKQLSRLLSVCGLNKCITPHQPTGGVTWLSSSPDLATLMKAAERWCPT